MLPMAVLGLGSYFWVSSYNVRSPIEEEPQTSDLKKRKGIKLKYKIGHFRTLQVLKTS